MPDASPIVIASGALISGPTERSSVVRYRLDSMAAGTAHPFASVLADAAAGRFPQRDGGVELFPPDRDGRWAVVEFTAHSALLAGVTPAEVAERGLHAYGACSHPETLSWLAGDRFAIGTLDAVLVAHGTGAGALRERDDLVDHPRVARALQFRRDLRVFGDERGVVLLGRGLADRWELAVELFDGIAEDRGAGRSLIAAALAAAPAGSAVWAQVAPGNAASLRAALAAGFVPVGCEVLLTPR
jgi:hypothetical protein